MGLQRVLRLIYPPQCLTCHAPVDSDHALCGSCWRETPFILGPVCDCCGVPLPAGSDTEGGPGRPLPRLVCDDCLALPRPWDRGRAAVLYDGRARDVVLKLKHADRLDLVPAAAGWMGRAVAPILAPEMLVAPVPLHWSRLLHRRYNQSAALALRLARAARLECCPDLLLRTRRTPSQEGRNRTGRFDNLDGAISLHPRRAGLIAGRRVLLVDDVMTSGATLAVAADACHAGGAAGVDVVVLARVAKVP